MSAAGSRKQRQEAAHERLSEKALTYLLRHMIREDAEGAPDAALRCVFCAFAPFLLAIFELRMDTRYVMATTRSISSKNVMRKQ
jgi:hypothetical protein